MHMHHCLLDWLMRLPSQDCLKVERKGAAEMTDLLGITAPENHLQVMPDFMMVDLATDHRPNEERRTTNREQILLKNMVGSETINIVEIGYDAKARYDDKDKAIMQQRGSLCQMSRMKDIRWISKLSTWTVRICLCFKAAVTAV